MADLDNRLLAMRLRDAVQADAQQPGSGDAHWASATEVFEAHSWEDDDLELAIMEKDADTIGQRLTEWEGGKQPYPPSDRVILKRALKAFRKRLKTHQLDDESSLGGGPFSSGRKSSIAAIQPPPQYPQEVWDELCRLKRIADDGQGLYELLED
jgi:hypothetical protein